MVVKQGIGIASISAVASVAAIGEPVSASQSDSAVLTATARMTASGVKVARGSPALSANAGCTATGQKRVEGTAELSATGVIVATSSTGMIEDVFEAVSAVTVLFSGKSTVTGSTPMNSVIIRTFNAQLFCLSRKLRIPAENGHHSGRKKATIPEQSGQCKIRE